jgi:hypothetical protein
MAVRSESLVIAVIAVVANPLRRRFATEVKFNPSEQLFQFLAEAGMVALASTLSTGVFDLDAGHAFSVGLGFG